MPDNASHLKVSVRQSRQADARALGEFFMRAWKEAGPDALGFTGATEEAIREISSEKFLTERLGSPNVKMLIATAGSDVIGFASLRKGGARSVELTGIVVLKRASGLGVGTRLVRKAFALATRLGFRTISVRTEVFNKRAIGFYRKNGFTESGKATEKVGRIRVSLQVLQKTLR